MATSDNLLTQFARLVQAFPQCPTLAEKEQLKADLFAARSAPEAPTIVLDTPAARAASPQERRNHRRFGPASVSLAQVAGMLGALRARRAEDDARAWRFPFASAGALYALTPYLQVHRRGDRSAVAALEVGSYRADLRAFGLDPACIGVDLEGAAHAPINRPVFAQAACSVHLVADFRILGAIYGATGIGFAMLEAGLMTQLLDDAAPAFGLGLSHTGAVDGLALGRTLGLEKGQLVLHTLLCGALPDPQ